MSGGVIGDTVSERENELPTDGTNLTCRESSRPGESQSRGTREGSEFEAVDRWWIRSFDESFDPVYPWVLNAPDDMLPDHPVADRGPYLSPGARVYSEGLIWLVPLIGVFSDGERGGTMVTSGDDSGES